MPEPLLEEYSAKEDPAEEGKRDDETEEGKGSLFFSGQAQQGRGDA